MYKLIQGDCLNVLKTLPDNSIQCVVTSPPYWRLRDYGTAKWEGGITECNHNPQRPDGGARSNRTLPLGQGGLYHDVCAKCGAVRMDVQMGLESTPEEYVVNMIAVFREVRRVLCEDGTCWLNLGDSYAGSGKGRNADGCVGGSGIINKGNQGTQEGVLFKSPNINGLKPKDLVGIPWRVAFALQADGWWLRQDIVWAKPNPMPESVTDRCTKSHEYIFLLTKSAHYYFDNEAIKEKAVTVENRPAGVVRDRVLDYNSKQKMLGRHGKLKQDELNLPTYTGFNNRYIGNECTMRNKRDVWFIATKPYKGAHFATFPPALVEPCILAGSKEGDIVLDCFSGAGTVGVVAKQYGRNYIGIELNPEYNKMADERINAMQSKVE